MKLKKIVLLSLLFIVLIGAGFVAYLMLTTRSHSPAEKMEFTDGNFHLAVDYCRPFKKGRMIFGEGSEGALLPYGKYWRTGANDATEVEFNKDISIRGEKIAAGRYRFYTIPGKEQWKIVFNSELGKWGYGEPDYEKDILIVEIPPENSSQVVEQFTISGLETGQNSMDLLLAWDQTQVRIPVHY